MNTLQWIINNKYVRLTLLCFQFINVFHNLLLFISINRECKLYNLTGIDNL